ncbi:MAG: GNAT family N-acetyltransferase [Candidatus Acidiferrales bacterium]
MKKLRASVRDLPVEFYRDEIDGIDSCFFACVEGHAAGIAWSYDHTKPAHFLRMSPGDAEIRSVYSLAEFRGRGLAKSVIATACESLAREGYRRIYAVIHFRNEASLRAFRSVGFTKVAELNRPPIFGPRYVTESGQTEGWLGAVARSFRSCRFRTATPIDRR